MKEADFGEDGGLIPGTKIIVTKSNLETWVAQFSGLDLGNFPPSKHQCTKEQYEIFDFLKAEYMLKRVE
jgi:hypothetical protein